MFKELGQKAKESYDSGRQLWVVSSNPLNTASTALYKECLEDSSKYDFSKLLISDKDKSDVYRHILGMTLPEWLIHPRSVMVDYSSLKNRRAKKAFSKMSGLPEDVPELLARKSIESKEKTSTLDKKIYGEIDFMLNVASQLPDPADWVNKTYEWAKKPEENLMARILKRSELERKREIFVDTYGRLDKTAIDFILKYYGNERISRNIFLIVFSMKMPSEEHKNWVLYLFSEKGM
jgi:hypothetical protein